MTESQIKNALTSFLNIPMAVFSTTQCKVLLPKDIYCSLVVSTADAIVNIEILANEIICIKSSTLNGNEKIKLYFEKNNDTSINNNTLYIDLGSKILINVFIRNAPTDGLIEVIEDIEPNILFTEYDYNKIIFLKTVNTPKEEIQNGEATNLNVEALNVSKKINFKNWVFSLDGDLNKDGSVTININTGE